MDFLKFGQRCLGCFWLIGEWLLLVQFDVWKCLELSVQVKKVKSGGFIFRGNGSIKRFLKMMDLLRLGQRRLGTPGMVLVD